MDISNKVDKLGTSTPFATELVSISFQELSSVHDDGDANNKMMIERLLHNIHQAYGEDNSLGILIIKDMPMAYTTLRSKVLPLAQQFATSLSKAELDGMTLPEANYQVGWSYGNERLDKNRMDTAKGSFYFNPLTDNILRDISLRDNVPLDAIVGSNNAAYVTPNIWPTIEGFECSMKDMGKLVHNIGLAVAKLCDLYVASKCPGYTQNKISTSLSKSLYCKARLLHYFPVDALQTSNDGDDSTRSSNTSTSNDYSNWCGWHNDHGSLTGLVPGMYVDCRGNILQTSPDPLAGLYIKSRNGRIHHVSIPSDSLAFQVGETSQIHSGGLLQATPHAVRGCSKPKGVTRESLAIFMEPEYGDSLDLPKGRSISDLQTANAEQNLPDTVKTLKSRYRAGMNFEAFSNATLAAFY